MKQSLKPGISYRLEFLIPEDKTIQHLYPEAPEFHEMPAVFATGFMVGLMEWTCMKVLEPHLDEGEGSVGVHVNVSHSAATPAGFTVTVDAQCMSVEGRRVRFEVSAHDGIDTIGKGEIERFVVGWDRFNRALDGKLAKAAAELGIEVNG